MFDACLTEVLLLQGKGKQKAQKVIKPKYKPKSSIYPASLFALVAEPKTQKIWKGIHSHVSSARLPFESPSTACTALQSEAQEHQGAEETTTFEWFTQIGLSTRWEQT